MLSYMKPGIIKLTFFVNCIVPDNHKKSDRQYSHLTRRRTGRLVGGPRIEEKSIQCKCCAGRHRDSQFTWKHAWRVRLINWHYTTSVETLFLMQLYPPIDQRIKCGDTSSPKQLNSALKNVKFLTKKSCHCAFWIYHGE